MSEYLTGDHAFVSFLASKVSQYEGLSIENIGFHMSALGKAIWSQKV
jgi:hypothetical protein